MVDKLYYLLVIGTTFQIAFSQSGTFNYSEAIFVSQDVIVVQGVMERVEECKISQFRADGVLEVCDAKMAVLKVTAVLFSSDNLELIAANLENVRQNVLLETRISIFSYDGLLGQNEVGKDLNHVLQYSPGVFGFYRDPLLQIEDPERLKNLIKKKL